MHTEYEAGPGYDRSWVRHQKGFLLNSHIRAGIDAMIAAGADRSRLLPSASHKVMPKSLHFIPEPDIPESRAAEVTQNGLAASIFVT
jgi:hypothetical protein